MDSTAYLHHLERELGFFRDCLHGELTAPVTHCGEWRLHDLAGHLGGGNLWAAAAVTERRGDYRAPDPPSGRDDLVRWFDEASGTLLTALDADPAAPAWTFHPPGTVGFWQRRRALEALVHRWDAQNALGGAAPFDAALASDGIAEVFDVMVPLQVSLGHVRPPKRALRIEATDTGASWTYGPGSPVATVAATAQDLLLLLWGRTPPAERSGEAFVWRGDQETAQRLLEDSLVP